MSVFSERWEPEAEYSATAGHGAVWLHSGNISRNGEALSVGTGAYMAPGDRLINTGSNEASVLRFSVGSSAPSGDAPARQITSTEVLSSTIESNPHTVILRLDQVDFPPAAIAYRHTHPGAGIRYLVHGGLQIESPYSTEQMAPGTAWFEDADSPVTATAIEGEPSCFVRLMLLPVEYEGKPTLTLLDKADADKPRLQTNTRHFDQRIVLGY